MALSKIIVTFNTLPNTGTILRIENDLSATTISEAFDDIRYSNGVTLIGADVDETANNYRIALELDYNSTNLYTITVLNNVVTIEAVQDGVTFSETFNSTSGAVTTVLDNEPATPELTIDTVVFSEADSDVCNKVKVTVTTSELATKVTSPLLIDPNVNNPFSFDWVRGVTIDIDCETATLNASQSTQLPDILSVGTTILTQFNTPTGSDLTVTHDSSFGLDLEYSLDDITYQTSNKFPGLTPNDYTLYVKDQLGCQISIPFTVSIFTPNISVTDPDFNISKSMSIRYKKDVDWGNCSDYKNEENTLSCEENVLLPYKTLQQFQTCDLVQTQVRNNYETLTANVIKSDGTKDALSISKITNFIDKKDKRDATYYAISGTQTGIYFTSGDTYDYDTGLQEGTYALNGLLPDWGAIGNFVFLDTIGWFTIVDIIEDESRNAEVLVIDYVYAGVETGIIVSSNYNLFNHDFYEFSVDMANYDNQQIQVEVLATDPTFTDIRWLSELIEVEERFDDTMEFLYWNPSNTDVYYFSGIKNKIRLKWQTFHPGVDGEIEGLDTDTNSVLLNSQAYETNIFVSFPVTIGVMRQIITAFVHKELYINGVKYRITEMPETEPFGQTNLQVITATFKKSGEVFNSQLDGTSTDPISDVELIGLIKYDDTNYLKY